MRQFIAWAILLVLASVVPAAAQSQLPLGLSEIRGGVNVTGVELWTFFQPYESRKQFRSLDTVEIELLFTPPDQTMLHYLGSPEISFGGHISTIGRASMVHLGLTWTAPIFSTPVFVEATLGGALTNSRLSGGAPPERNVGCPLLFYLDAAVGYQFDQHWSVMGNVYHASHAGLCEKLTGNPGNDGLNGFGVKVGYKF